jgi:beta-glucosidase
MLPAVNQSGRLPVTIPQELAQTPRPELGMATGHTRPRINYNQGAQVSQRRFAKASVSSLYAFGHGLSQTTFDCPDLHLDSGDTITATFTVTTTGARLGAEPTCRGDNCRDCLT